MSFRSLSRLAGLSLAIAVIAWAAVASAEQFQIRGCHGQDFDFFGGSVATDGETAMAGSQYGEFGYVFERIPPNWVRVGKLTAPDTNTRWFGYSVAVSGFTAVAGAPFFSFVYDNSAYVFERIGNEWARGPVLTLVGGSNSPDYGREVAIDGDRMVMGVFRQPAQHIDGPLVFERIGGNWSQVASLVPNEAGTDGFGIPVALSGDRIVVGSIPASESAYVFERTGGVWAQVKKLTASDGAPGNEFGTPEGSLSISGDYIVVGTFTHEAAYVFERVAGVWTEVKKLTASDAAPGQRFGRAVAVDGERILVAAYGDSTKGTLAGAVYLYRRIGGTWTESRKISACDGAAGDYFGYSVALHGDRAIIGTPGRFNGSVGDGAAYVLESIDGPTESCARVFGDGFESGDTCTWSTAVP